LATQSTSKWDTALALYGAGAADVEICKLFEITEAKFDRMYSEVPQFAAIVDYGRTISKAWWYSQLRSNIKSKEFNSSLFNFAMKNLHGWADKVESSSKDASDKSADQLRTEFQALVKRLEQTDPALVRNLVSVSSG
jgi:hypothetical protein